MAPTQSTFYTLWSEPESGRALECSHAELVRAGPSQHAPCALGGQGFGSVIWRPGSQTVGTMEPGYQEPQQALPVGRGFDSSAWGHPLEPLTLMLQNWWFSEDTSETCREYSREGGSLGVGGPGISQRLPHPCQSEQPYRKGIAFSAPTIPGSMGHF